MIKLLTILLFLSGTAFGQVLIGSKSYIKSYNVVNQDTSVLFKPAGYADYPVKPTNDGVYIFTVRVLNNTAKSSLVYFYSPATGAWSNSFMPMSANYQNIPVKVMLNVGTSYVRLYFADGAIVDRISYVPDVPAPTVDLSPILLRITNLEAIITNLKTRLDTLPDIYIQKDYGTQTNPIRP